jgi:hypothetical protein
MLPSSDLFTVDSLPLRQYPVCQTCHFHTIKAFSLRADQMGARLGNTQDEGWLGSVLSSLARG